MSISLDDHERRIKDFEGKIVEIGDRITAVENRPGSIEVTLGYDGLYGRPGVTLDKPSNVINMNYVIKSLRLSTANNDRSTKYSINNGVVSIEAYDGSISSYTITDNGNSITIRSTTNNSKGSLRLLSGVVFIFYK